MVDTRITGSYVYYVLYDKNAINKLVIDFYEEECIFYYDLQLFGEQWVKCRE